RDEDRPVGRSHVRKAGGGEALSEELVPAVARVREQEAEVLAPEVRRRAIRGAGLSGHPVQPPLAAAEEARVLSDSPPSGSYCDSNSSSGIPGALNIVNE